MSLSGGTVGLPAPVPILTYHSLDGSDSVISIRPETFVRQMRRVAELGYTGISVRDLLDGWDGKRALPEKPVAITFDDGFANFEAHGGPILEELGFRATVFAIAGLVGRTNAWPGQAGGIPDLPLMSWPVLGSLEKAGFEIGAHTVTHPRLPTLSDAEARREVVESRRILEDRLGIEVRTFAYPFGQVGGTRSLVEETFDIACGTHLAIARSVDDRHELPRVDMYYLRHPAAFRLFGGSAGTAYIGARRAGNRVRGWLERAGVLRPA